MIVFFIEKMGYLLHKKISYVTIIIELLLLGRRIMGNVRTFNHLSAIERGKIEALLDQNLSIAEIARKLNRHYNTIYHEVRNKRVKQIKKDKDVRIYYADTAQEKYKKNRENSKNKLKFLQRYKFIHLLETLFFEKKWSIEVCVEYIKRNYPNIKTLCFRTIYNYIDKGLMKIKNIDLQEKVTRKKTRKKRTKENKKIYGESIETRQENKEIEERLEFGHWEADTVKGKKGKTESCLLTIVERKSRFLIIKKLKNATAEVVNDAMIKIIKKYQDFFKSITFDNGTEFSSISHEIIAAGLHTRVYFAHPYSSWERGTNERHNKLIRRFIKKGVSINPYSENAIKQIENWINDLPRKILNWSTPKEQLLIEQTMSLKIG